ncbi:hypothetical protein GAYE_PCTG32G0804 [Galdieria yellowstonensis]|uniref:Myb-like domain-containing protein n=1 Tax=Galdieria yellowstonensis TaxID=3028027 RepID=A0AAV9I6L1_9RHOD|nr:hypothetical protein GAYE_PCTG32G0804 [Galdieria yellowstonensis]
MSTEPAVRIPPSLAPSKDSLSLWNFSLSPGWTKEEVRILSLCLMSFGVGRWQKIVDSGYLPNKTISQLNLQTQRLLGQQSVAEFTGLCIDPAEVREHNERRIAQGAKTKGGIIVNTGPNPTKEVIMSRLKENASRFGLKDEQVAVAKAQLMGIIQGQKLQRSCEKFSLETRRQAVAAMIRQAGRRCDDEKKKDDKQISALLCVDKQGLQLYSLEEKGEKNTEELRNYLVKLMNTLQVVNDTIETMRKDAMQDITNLDHPCSADQEKKKDDDQVERIATQSRCKPTTKRTR